MNRGGFNRNNFKGGFFKRAHPYQHDNGRFRQPQRQFNEYNTYNPNTSNSTEPSKAQTVKNNEPNNEVKRLKEITMLPYLERRNLKALLTGNPRFHLVTFNGVPKYIKASVFLSDMVLHIPEIKAKTIISVHSSVNAVDNNLIDFQVGFNSVKIIKRLEEILGTGYFELYKNSVQLVIPDIESYNNCEYNQTVNDDLTQHKQPYKLTHSQDMNILKVMEMLEEICNDKYHYISAICNTGNITYINVNNSSSVLLLSSAAEMNKFKIEACDTIAIIGTIPSSLIPTHDIDTPVNISATSKMTPEEIVKFGGFKMIFEKFSKELKDKDLNMIKRALRESQATVQRSLDENERRVDEKLSPLETKVNTCLSRLEEISEKYDRNLSYMQSMEQNIFSMEQNIIHAINNKTPVLKATTTKTPNANPGKNQRPQRGSVNPPISGTTEKAAKPGDDKWKNLEKEIDETNTE